MTYAGNLLSLDPANPVKAAKKRAQFIRRGMVSYIETLDQIAAAYAAHDWETLGYESWGAYVDGEFGVEKLRLSRKARESAVAALRLNGLSTRAIGAVLGVDPKTVVNDLASAQISTPEKVLGADGKQHPAKHDKPPAGAVPEVDPTTAPAGTSEPPAAVQEGVPAAVGSEGFVPDRPAEEWPTTAEPGGAVTSAVPAGPTSEAPADPDPEVEYRPWRSAARASLSRAWKAVNSLTGDLLDVDTVAQRADDPLIADLQTLVDDLTRFLKQVRDLRPASEEVWVAAQRHGIMFHRPDAPPDIDLSEVDKTVCGRSTRAGKFLPRRSAEIGGLDGKPCPRCWPTLALVPDGAR